MQNGAGLIPKRGQEILSLREPGEKRDEESKRDLKGGRKETSPLPGASARGTCPTRKEGPSIAVKHNKKAGIKIYDKKMRTVRCNPPPTSNGET